MIWKTKSPVWGEAQPPHRDVFSGLCMRTLEPSARVPVCSCGAVNQTNPAKREQRPGTGPRASTGKKTPQWHENHSLSTGDKVSEGEGGVRRDIYINICVDIVKEIWDNMILSGTRGELEYNKERWARRRVGSVHILHSSAPGCQRLEVAQHLCHFGLANIWAGVQCRGNICIISESLDRFPRSWRVLLEMTTLFSTYNRRSLLLFRGVDCSLMQTCNPSITRRRLCEFTRTCWSSNWPSAPDQELGD